MKDGNPSPCLLEETHREEHVLLVLIDGPRVRHWVRVFDDRHGLSCRETKEVSDPGDMVCVCVCVCIHTPGEECEVEAVCVCNKQCEEHTALIEASDYTIQP